MPPPFRTDGMDSDNPIGADDQQETERDPQRLHAKPVESTVKIQSEPHGDMGSQAEMIWPLTDNCEE